LLALNIIFSDTLGIIAVTCFTTLHPRRKLKPCFPVEQDFNAPGPGFAGALVSATGVVEFGIVLEPRLAGSLRDGSDEFSF